jgi:hypothetical protein
MFDESRHVVYRKMSAQLNAILMQQYAGMSDVRNGQALNLLLSPIYRYQTVFDQQCRICKLILKDELPPLVLEMRLRSFSHDSCR